MDIMNKVVESPIFNMWEATEESIGNMEENGMSNKKKKTSCTRSRFPDLH